MRVRNVTIGIKSVEEGLIDFVEAYEAARLGDPYHGVREGVYFTSIEAMRRVLSPKRLGLLQLIRERRPDSVYALARLAGRDLKNVQADVALLARLDLVSLRKTKTRRKRVVPRVDYDQLQLRIPLARPL